jgi:NAD(P)-dependent dehydrogenase (short-subunit alcohol dehydrogenase family)
VRTVCITGSAGGIGGATRARLEREGARVLGVDVRDAEVVADLSTPAGRDAMVAAVADCCDGVLDGLVAAAGIMGDQPLVVAINYFGAIATTAAGARHRRVGGGDQLELDDDDTRAADRPRRRAARG